MLDLRADHRALGQMGEHHSWTIDRLLVCLPFKSAELQLWNAVYSYL